jgi:transcriptional regulator with XRE-family HTH domain
MNEIPNLNPSLPDPDSETPNERLRLIRRALGLSAAEMAEQFGLQGEDGAQQVREMERDNQPIARPIYETHA